MSLTLGYHRVTAELNTVLCEDIRYLVPAFTAP